MHLLLLTLSLFMFAPTPWVWKEPGQSAPMAIKALFLPSGIPDSDFDFRLYVKDAYPATPIDLSGQILENVTLIPNPKMIGSCEPTPVNVRWDPTCCLYIFEVDADPYVPEARPWWRFKFYYFDIDPNNPTKVVTKDVSFLELPTPQISGKIGIYLAPGPYDTVKVAVGYRPITDPPGQESYVYCTILEVKCEETPCN